MHVSALKQVTEPRQHVVTAQLGFANGSSSSVLSSKAQVASRQAIMLLNESVVSMLEESAKAHKRECEEAYAR
jgi:hypothetical protein